MKVMPAYIKCLTALIFFAASASDVYAGALPAGQDSFPSLAAASLPIALKDPADLSLTALRKATDPGQEPMDGLVGLHPMAADFVRQYIDQNRNFLLQLCGRNQSTLRTMEKILSSHGLPIELKYLAIIESKLSRTVKSPMGAAGPWQLMPVTARAMGLRVRPGLDERLDIRKSSQAAAKI